MINRRSLLDLPDHDADFRNQHYRKQNKEYEECGLYRAYIQL